MAWSSRHVTRMPCKPQLATLPRTCRLVLGMPCDVRVLDEVRALAQAAAGMFRRIDIWVNNAGIVARLGASVEWDRPAALARSYPQSTLSARTTVAASRSTRCCRTTVDKLSTSLASGETSRLRTSRRMARPKPRWRSLTQTLARANLRIRAPVGQGRHARNDLDGDVYVCGRAGSWSKPHQDGVGDAVLRESKAQVPARFVVQMAEQGDVNGKTFRLLTPRVFVPRMVREMVGGAAPGPGGTPATLARPVLV